MLSAKHEEFLNNLTADSIPPGAIVEGFTLIARLMFTVLSALRKVKQEDEALGDDTVQRYAISPMPRYAYSLDELRDLPDHDDEWLLTMRRIDVEGERVVMTMRGRFVASDCQDLMTMLMLLQVLDRSRAADVTMPGHAAAAVAERGADAAGESMAAWKMMHRGEVLVEAAALCGALVRQAQSMVFGGDVAALDRSVWVGGSNGDGAEKEVSDANDES